MHNIDFKIHHIEIEQFAAIEEPRQGKVSFNITVKPGCNINLKSIAISVESRFMEDGHPFLLLKTTSFFQFEPQSWEGLKDGETGRVVIPEPFIITLLQISISQTRGVLCAKTESTPFAKFILPIVNVGDFVQKGDFIILPDGSIAE